MAKRVGVEDIQRINELYFRLRKLNVNYLKSTKKNRVHLIPCYF